MIAAAGSRWYVLLALVPGLAACGDSGAPGDRPSAAIPDSGVESGACAAGQQRGTACIPRLDECARGEIALPGGGCRTVGVPADGCGTGFVHVGSGRCDPVLPAARCPDGEMAIPGETTCRPVAPCPPSRWGAAPVDAETIFVDVASPGSGDGSEARPFATLAHALARAATRTGAPLVAITDGTYAGDLDLSAPVRLWGRCPSLVTIRGADASRAALDVTATGVELRDLSITAPSRGVFVSGARDVVLDRVRIHDTGHDGLRALGGAVVTVTASLLERVSVDGIWADDATAIVERSEVRDVRPLASNRRWGWGLAATSTEPTGRGRLEVRRCVVSRTRGAGIGIGAADGIVEDTAILEALPDETDPDTNFAVHAYEEHAGLRPDLTVTRSTVLEAQTYAFHVSGGRLTLVGVVVADGVPDALYDYSAGLNAVHSEVVVTDSLFEGHRGALLDALGSDVTFVRTAMRGVRLDAPSGFGQALVIADDAMGASASLVLEESVVEDSDMGAIVAIGASVKLTGSAVRDSLGVLASEGAGTGILVAQNPLPGGQRGTLQLLNAVVERSRAVGVLLFGASGTIERSVVRGTHASENGTLGDGVSALTSIGAPEPDVADLAVAGSLVTDNARAGISVFGANATLAASALSCNAFDLDVERHYRRDAAGAWLERDFSMTDQGENSCGCDAFAPCKAESANLAPAPPPL